MRRKASLTRTSVLPPPSSSSSPPPPPPSTVVSPLIVRGTLTNIATGYPLQGLSVRAYFLEPPGRQGNKQNETLLGRAVTDARGAYQIMWSDSPVVTDRLCLLRSCAGCQYTLKVSEGSSSPLLVTQPTTAPTTINQVDLQVPIPKKKGMTKQQWVTLGKRLKAARVSTVSGLVQSLLDASTSLPAFKGWPLTDRQNALSELESAFLDPGGVLDKLVPLPSWQQLGSPNGLTAYTRSLGRKPPRGPQDPEGARGDERQDPAVPRPFLGELAD